MFNNKKLENLLSSGISTDSFYEKRQIYMTNAIILLSSIVVATFAFLNLNNPEYFIIGIMDLIALALLISSLLLIRKTKSITFSRRLITTIMLSFIVILTYFYEANNFSLIWVIFVPIISMSLHGARLGLILSIITFALILSIAYFNIGVWQNGNWSIVSYIKLTISMFILTGIYYATEQSLYNYHLNEQEIQKDLMYLSMTDYLTDLPNRRGLLQEINFQANHSQETYSIAILDIDDFKQTNDNHGHEIGDKVLKDISNLIQTNLNGNQIIGRWGGEEFIILFPDTDIQDATEYCEQIRKKIENQNFTGLQITCSFGVAEAKQNLSINNIIKKADDSLYKAKHNGKNQVVFSL